jgi:acyl carrier protein
MEPPGFKVGPDGADEKGSWEVLTMDETIKGILAEHGRLSCDATRLADDDDLYRVGLTSHGTVNVMLALEDAFDIEVPDHMLRKSTFQSVASIRAAVTELTSSTQSA